MTDGRASVGAFRWRGLGPGAAIAAASILSAFAPAAFAADPPALKPAASPSTPGSAAPATTTPAPPRKITQADRDAARGLAEQGFEKLQQRQYDAAIELFHKAEELFHAPTHLVYLAQAYEQKGLLLEAADSYRTVLAESLPRDAPQPFREAQSSAARELERLLHRTPKLRVEVGGVDPARTVIEVGERKILPGASAFWNPGSYLVRATSDEARPAERAVVLADGGEVVVRFELARPMSLVWPVAAFGVGVAAGATAVITGVISFNQGREASAACAKAVICPAAEVSKMARSQQLRDAAIASGIAGGVALAAGLTLVLIRPSNQITVEPAAAGESAARAPLAPTLALRAGPTSLTLVGTF